MLKATKKIVIFSIILTLLLTAFSFVHADNEKIIVLDPGHGGNDNGTTGNLNGTNYYEKNLNLKVAEFVWEALAEYNGVKVYMTRQDDTKLSILSRTMMPADLKADLLVSLHMNALDNAANFGGSEIFVPKGTYRPELAQVSSAIAESILDKFETLGMRKIGVKTSLLGNDSFYNYPDGSPADYYGIIRNSVNQNIPSMIIEHGYLSNQKDLSFLTNDANLQKLARATAQSIAEYYGLSKGAGNKITLKKQSSVTIAPIPTSLKVGDAPIELSASGGSGSGKMRFESNDKNVLQIQGNKLVIVGEGKANITAVRGTDGTYLSKQSENYIRITVTDTGFAPVTPNPSEQTPDVSGTTTIAPVTNGSATTAVAPATDGSGSSNTTGRVGGNSTPSSTTGTDKDNTLTLVIAIVGGIIAAIVIVAVIGNIIVKRRRKQQKERNRRAAAEKNNRNNSSRYRQRR